MVTGRIGMGLLAEFGNEALCNRHMLICNLMAGTFSEKCVLRQSHRSLC
jgi:hypothetical protein